MKKNLLITALKNYHAMDQIKADKPIDFDSQEFKDACDLLTFKPKTSQLTKALLIADIKADKHVYVSSKEFSDAMDFLNSSKTKKLREFFIFSIGFFLGVFALALIVYLMVRL